MFGDRLRFVLLFRIDTEEDPKLEYGTDSMEVPEGPPIRNLFR